MEETSVLTHFYRNAKPSAMNFFGNKKPEIVASLHLDIKSDGMVELSINGDHVKVGGALTSVMINNPHIYGMFGSALQAAQRGMAMGSIINHPFSLN